MCEYLMNLKNCTINYTARYLMKSMENKNVSSEKNFSIVLFLQSSKSVKQLSQWKYWLGTSLHYKLENSSISRPKTGFVFVRGQEQVKMLRFIIHIHIFFYSNNSQSCNLLLFLPLFALVFSKQNSQSIVLSS